MTHQRQSQTKTTALELLTQSPNRTKLPESPFEAIQASGIRANSHQFRADMQHHSMSLKAIASASNHAIQSKPKFRGLSHELANSPALAQVIQAKLTFGQPDDRYEREADRVASDVVTKINSPQLSQQAEGIQRQDKDKEEIQPKLNGAIASGNATPDLEASIQNARGSGQPLADTIRKPMEQAFGADFSAVKVHTDAQSDQLNKSIQAKAFTTGADIFFREGAYDPASPSGQELIAHELTHVVQQNRQFVRSETSSLPQMQSKLNLKQTNSPSGNLELIQRAVGMEFECTNLAITKEPKDAKKKDVLKEDSTDHWKMTYEETSEGTPVVEFVVDPAVETKKDLDDAIQGIQTEAKAVDKKDPVDVGAYEVTLNGNLEGAIQITLGTPLKDLPKLYALYRDITSTSPSKALERLKKLESGKQVNRQIQVPKSFGIGLLKVHWTKTRNVTTTQYEKAPDGTLVKDLSDPLKGFLLLLMDYIVQGFVPTEYRGRDSVPFVKGLFPVMARTDFNSIFKTLSGADIDLISEDIIGTRYMKKEWWKWIIMKALNNDSLTEEFLTNDQLINIGVKSLGTKGADPVRSQFLENIPNTDKLKDEGYLGVGELGNKVDVSHNDPKKFAPIFELRAPYGSSIHYAKWNDIADETWCNYIKIVGERMDTGGRVG